MTDATHFFQEQHIPKDCRLIGRAALVEQLDIEAPVRTPSCVSQHHVKGSVRREDEWRIYDKRYLSDESLTGHLTFALKHEAIDLLALKRIFEAFPQDQLISHINGTPTGPASRRAWFFYEFLTSHQLNITATPPTNIIDALDADKYFVATQKSEVSKRHRVRNNLLGNAQFCPIIQKTNVLQDYIAADYSAQAKQLLSNSDTDLVSRAANFMLVADTRATFAIEGEKPPLPRLQRWARAVQQAGKYELTIPELERLQKILIEDTRFVSSGLRKKMVFLSKSDSIEDALPEFIPAKPEDLTLLLEGLLDTNSRMSEDALDAVLQAATIAFGFVYIHPFEDGNGRIHRCMIHNILSRRGFTPPEIVFPVSDVMARKINEYDATLRSHSAELMPYIKWEPLRNGIKVTNDTADLYRYFDATRESEYLYSCIERAVKSEIPLELEYLQRHDQAMEGIMNKIDLPDSLAKTFILFMRQNGWKLPKKRRENEFEKMKDEEVAEIESIVQAAFSGFPEEGIRSRSKSH